MSLMLMVRFSLLFGIFACAGCSSLFGDHGVFRSKKNDYLNTSTIKTIELPEGMASRSLETLYSVPAVEPRDEFGDVISLVEYEIPRPAPINTEKGKTGVKIQKIADKRWVFINASTSQVWPRTQNFLSRYGFPVVDSNPAIGLIETGDVVYGDDNNRKSRFRIFIEKGVHPETTEVHVLQRDFGVDEVAPTNAEWPKVSTNLALEKKLVEALAQTLAQSVNNNSASLLGQNVGGSLKVEFLKDQPEPTMRLRLYEQRAHATLSHALNRDGFLLWGELKAEGLYYVGFDPQAGKGRSFMFGLFRDSYPEDAPYDMTELLSSLSAKQEVKDKFEEVEGASFGKPLEEKLGYLVLLESSDTQSDVVLRDMSGEKLPEKEAKALLRIIRKNLI